MKRSWRVSRKQANARTRMYGLGHIDDRSVAPWMACHLTKSRRGRDYAALSSPRYPAPLESRTRHPVSPVQREKVHRTFFFSASPPRLAPSGPPSLRSGVPNRSRRFWSNPTGSHPSTCSTIFLTRGMNPRVRKMAEREGFEPPDPYGSTVFKTAALNRSATSPSYSRITEIKIDVLSFAQGNRSSP